MSCALCADRFLASASLLPAGKSGSGEASLIVMDMGQHIIKHWPEPQLLHQVLVPGLEDRARLMPELATLEQVAAGMFPPQRILEWVLALVRRFSVGHPGRDNQNDQFQSALLAFSLKVRRWAAGRYGRGVTSWPTATVMQ